MNDTTGTVSLSGPATNTAALSKKLIPVVTCINVEPAKRQMDLEPQESWVETDECLEYFSSLRERLESLTASPAHFTWFLRLDPQIEKVHGDAAWSVKRYRSWLDRLERCGDEIAVHTHAWRWCSENGRWIADHANAAWVSHCIELSARTYERSFGRKPASFQFGDRWMSNRAMAQLERLGFKYDLSVEPGHPSNEGNEHECTTGLIPDYRVTPSRPYRPSIFDFRRPGLLFKRDIWVIPMSTHLLTAKELGQPLSDATYPWTVHLVGPLSHTIPSLKEILSRTEPVILSFPIRTGDIHRADHRKNFFENMEYLVGHERIRDFRFVNPGEALDMYLQATRGTVDARKQR